MVSAEQTGLAGRSSVATGRIERWMGPVLAFIGALAFYVTLHGELPYHDVFRFIAQIESNEFVWDMGHVWLQPVTLLWHWYLGFGESAEASQWHINAVFTAAGVAVFYWGVTRFEMPLWQRLLATALVAGGCNIVTLAPTAHMKLLAFPFLTGSFMVAALWERDHRAGLARNRDLVLSGVLMAIAGAFHSSCLAAPPFVGLVILFSTLRQGEGWAKGIGRAALYGLTAGLLFALSLEIARIAFFHEMLTPGNFADTIGDKNDLRTGWFSWSDLIGRMVFGTVNNFIAAPELGPVIRAWLLHQIPSLGAYAGRIIPQALPWFATLFLLAWVYLRGAYLAARGRIIAMPLAFILGSWAWNSFFNINEPEHWFHLTVPTVFLALLAFQRRTISWLLSLWTGLTLAMNLTLWSWPEARYPLSQYQSELARDYGPNDLFLYFIAYGGGPNMQFVQNDDTPFVYLDALYEDSKDPQSWFAEVQGKVDPVLEKGGKVVIVGSLDPTDWNAPWMLLTRDGLPKAKFVGMFEDHYKIEPMPDLAEMKAWRLEPKN